MAALEWGILDSDFDKRRKVDSQKLLYLRPELPGLAFLRSYIVQQYVLATFHSWPTLTFPRRRPDRFHYQQMKASGQAVRVHANAFADIYAENDLFLFPVQQTSGKLALNRLGQPQSPEWYEELKDRVQRSDLVHLRGVVGVGKTASALMLAREMMSGGVKDGSLCLTPFYWRCSPMWETPSIQLRQFAISYARSLVSYLSVVPYEFMEMSHQQRRSVAYLVSLCFGNADDLRLLFSRHRVRSAPIPESFFDTFISHVRSVSPRRLNLGNVEDDALLHTIHLAGPPNLFSQGLEGSEQRPIALIDVQSHHLAGSAQFLGNLDTTISHLRDTGMAVVTFTPSNSDSSVKLPFDNRTMHAVWRTDEMIQLLEDRLLAIDPQMDRSLYTLIDGREVDQTHEEMQNRIINASWMIPRRLMEIGRGLVLKIQAKNGLLDQDDFNNVLKPYEDEQP